MRNHILICFVTVATFALVATWSVSTNAAGAHGKGPGFAKQIYKEQKEVMKQRKPRTKAAKRKRNKS